MSGGFNGALLAIAVVIIIVGYTVTTVGDHLHPGKTAEDARKREGWERVASVVYGLAAFAAVLGSVRELKPLYEATGGGIGLIVLIAVLVIVGSRLAFTLFGGSKHHRHATTIMAVIFAAGGAMAVGGWKTIKHSTAQGLGHAGTGVTAAASGNAGAGHSDSGKVLIGAVLVLLVVSAVAAWRMRSDGEPRKLLPAWLRRADLGEGESRGRGQSRARKRPGTSAQPAGNSGFAAGGFGEQGQF